LGKYFKEFSQFSYFRGIVLLRRIFDTKPKLCHRDPPERERSYDGLGTDSRGRGTVFTAAVAV